MFDSITINETKPSITADEARRCIAAELKWTRQNGELPLEALTIVGSGANWRTALGPVGGRIDEALCAKVYEVGRQLAEHFVLADESVIA